MKLCAYLRFVSLARSVFCCALDLKKMYGGVETTKRLLTSHVQRSYTRQLLFVVAQVVKVCSDSQRLSIFD